MSHGSSPEQTPASEMGNFVYKTIVMFLEWIDEKLGKQEWGDGPKSAHH